MVSSTLFKTHVKTQDLRHALTRQVRTSKLPSASGKKTNSGATRTWWLVTGPQNASFKHDA
jgi:hypothetical protein